MRSPDVPRATTDPCELPAWVGGLTEWIELDPHPRFIVSPALVCLWMNKAAKQMVEEEGRARSDQPSRRALTFFDQDGLTALIGEAADGGIHWASIRDRNGNSAIVWARGLGGNPPNLFGLVLLPPDEQRDFHGFYESARLTPAEARIVNAMLRGESIAGAAFASGVSRETIKTHLRNAYRKLGVSSRGELFAEAQRFLEP